MTKQNKEVLVEVEKPHKIRSRSRQDVLFENIKSSANTHRRPYKLLSLRQQNNQIRDITAKMIGCCVDKKLEENGVKDYIDKNKS